jgi:FAD/FMN-containing dehydrogenase
MNNNFIPDFKFALNSQGINELSADAYQVVERALPGNPSFALKPKNTDELQTILKLANTYKIPLIISAGRTGLVYDQAAYNEEVMLDLSALNKMQKITFADGSVLNFTSPAEINDLPEHWKGELKTFLAGRNLNSEEEIREFTEGAKVKVDTAVRLYDLNQVLGAAYISVPMDSGAANKIDGNATSGAFVANASHGADGVSNGTGAEQADNVTAISDNSKFIKEFKGNGLRTDARADETKPILDSASLQYGIDTAFGAQGKPWIITEVEFNTKPTPAQRFVFYVAVDSAKEANELRKEVQEQFPGKIRQYEIINKAAANLPKDYHAEEFINPFTGDKSPIESKYLVLLDVNSSSKAEELFQNIYLFLDEKYTGQENKFNAAIDHEFNPDHSMQESFRKLRHAITPAGDHYNTAMGKQNNNPDGKYKQEYDVCVPLEKLDGFLDEYERRINEFALEKNLKISQPFFGHGGVGAMHLYVLCETDMKQKLLGSDKTILEEIDNIYLKTVKEFGGSYTAEHGVGQKWGKVWMKETPLTQVAEKTACMLQYGEKNIVNSKSHGFDAVLKTLETGKDEFAHQLRAEVRKVCEQQGFGDAISRINEIERKISNPKSDRTIERL